MPIKLDCPRCKRPLLVPNKKTGGYVTCTHCNGRVWVPKSVPADSPQIDAAPLQGGVGAGWKIAEPLPPSAGLTPTGQTPPPAKKVARFISAEAAQSTLKPAEDGQLPELHLREGEKKEKKQAESRTINPLVLFGALSISVALSILLVMVDFGSPRASSSQEKAKARQMIQDDYIADQEHFTNPESAPPLEPYQVYLREAQRAYSRGDRKTERQMYRKVLNLLRAERDEFGGLTGSPSNDQTLEEQISILLSED